MAKNHARQMTAGITPHRLPLSCGASALRIGTIHFILSPVLDRHSIRLTGRRHRTAEKSSEKPRRVNALAIHVFRPTQERSLTVPRTPDDPNVVMISACANCGAACAGWINGRFNSNAFGSAPGFCTGKHTCRHGPTRTSTACPRPGQALAG